MNCDLDEQQQQQQTNQADFEEDNQQQAHFIIDYEQLKQDILFYLLILIQILFVFIIKWATNNSIIDSSDDSESSNQESSSSSSTQQNGQQNTNDKRSKQTALWSSLNVLLLMITAGCLIYSITIYRKVMKRAYYTVHTIANYLIIAFLCSYSFSKPSPSQSILFFEYSRSNEKVYEGGERNRQTEMYDLYFILMLSNRIQNSCAVQISIPAKIVLHTIAIVISMYKTSTQGYIPLVLVALQFITADVLLYLFARTQALNQTLYCSCSSLKAYCLSSSSDMHQQNKKAQLCNTLNAYDKTHHNHTDGTLFHDQNTTKNLHTSFNNSYYLKAYNNLAKNGTIGKRSQQIHKFVSSRNGIDFIGKSPEKKLKKMNLSSINSFWNINKKDPLKQSGESHQLKEADEKWQQYLNQIPSGIILIKKNLNQVKFANEFIRQFFFKNFRKFNEDEILDMILREIEFKILSHVVNHTSNEKKRITRFSSSAKKQIRESISNAEKKSGKRSSNNNNNNVGNQLQNTNNGVESKNSTGNFSHFHQSVKNHNIEDFNSQKSPLTQPLPINQTYSNITPQNSNQINKTESEKSTLESILINFDQNHQSLKDIENSTLEIYAKVLNIENKESISLKGKVLYRSEGDEFLIILEDNTKYENVTNLADRDDYKNRLISSFSHELRTPLNSSMGFLQSALLDDQVFQAAKDTYLVPAYQSLKLQYYFINDILDFSQILAKRDLQLNFVKFNMSKLVFDIRDLYENSFASKGISLLFQLDNKILVNLINNSLRFTLKGGITIKISPTIQNNLFIHVIDTGEGMNLQQFEQLKQKLSSFGTSGIAITETQHTGFGLTISQIIVSILASESNQDLELKKTVGGGCTFSFCIENILNIQTSFSITNSHNNSRLDVLRSGTKIISRKDNNRKSTYAHKTLEKQSFGKALQFSSHSLYTKHNKELKRGNSASITRIEDLKAPIIGFFKAQASVFKKNQLPTQNETLNNGAENNELAAVQQNKLQNVCNQQSGKLSFELNDVENNEVKQMRKNSLNQDNQLAFSSIKQFQEGESTTAMKQNKSQLMIHITTPTNNFDDALQASSFNVHNQQISTYSQQKRFFISQSQAILTSHHNLFAQKEKNSKMQDQDFEDNEKSYVNNDSMFSHSDCFENKLQTYNFNSLIHSNVAIFSSPLKRLTNLNTFDSVIENNEIEQHQVKQQGDNAQIGQQEMPLLEFIEVKTPLYSHVNVKADVDLARASTNQDENQIKNKNRNNLKLTINGNQKHPSFLKNQKDKIQTPIKTIIQTPGSKKITPNKINNVKFCFQVDSKTTSDKEESSESQKSARLPQMDLKQKACSFNPFLNDEQLGTRKDSIFNYKETQKEENINRLVQNLMSFDPQQGNQNQEEGNKSNKGNTNQNLTMEKAQSQNTNYDISQGNNAQNSKLTKAIENINNVFQNQMQLSEQFSEISWQQPQNYPNSLFNNQIPQNGVLSKRGQYSPKTNGQLNQNIYFNISRMKQVVDNTNSLGLNLGFQNPLQSHFNDTETANFLTQKENSTIQNNLPKQMKNSGWVRKASLQLIEKEEKQNREDEEGLIRPHQMSEVIERPMTPHLQIFMKCQCRRVLCVDDEIFNLQVLLFLFQKLDYQIEKAYNGKDAINIFTSFYQQKSKYHCESPNCTVFKAIILDCNMPIMNGWDCAKELRNLMNQKKLPSIPIIALTAYVTQQAYNQCIESGMDHVLNKPINIEVLRNTVENYIHLYDTDQKNIQWV